MKTRKQSKEREYPLGTVFNPHVVEAGYRIRFQYDDDAYLEVMLEPDGALNVRASGGNSDLLLTEHHVANNLFVRPRRYSTKTNRHEPFYAAQEGGAQ